MADPPATRRGALIVIEGLDRAGKSTQCERLCARIQNNGLRVKHMRFPDRSTPIGQSINAYLIGESNLEDHVIHLLFAANRWEAAAQIRRDIAKGTTIVIDRYYYSGIVYSAAKDNPELALEWARQPEVGLPRPDVCILLDISPEDAVERGGFGSEKYENRKMQVRVRELFGQLLSERQEVEDITVVDAAQSLEDVEEDVWRAAEVCFENLIAEFPLRTVKPWLSFDG